MIMASLMVHQVIGQEYCKRHKVNNVYSFLMGNLDPDMTQDKKVSHFSAKCRNATYTDSIKNKVNLTDFCSSISIGDDYYKGYFLHLITDMVYFNRYLLNNPKYREIEFDDQLAIQAIMYRDYHRNNKYLMDKYPNLMLSLLPDNAKVTRDDVDDMEILSNEAIDEIIETCANANLEKIYEGIGAMGKDFYVM